MQQPEWVLASDIDHTLTGDRDALDRLRAQLTRLREEKKLFLVLPTGRTFADVLSGFENEGLPWPDAVSCQVGTEIYLPPFSRGTTPLPDWTGLLLREFSREKALEFLQGIDGLRMQPELCNTSLKVSCYLHQTPDPEQAAALIKQRIVKAKAENAYRVIWSSGRDLDIIPAKSGKGNAVSFILKYLGLSPSKEVIVAGDSGNDRAMFDIFSHGIVVKNAQLELKRLRQENPPPSVYFAQKESAAGVEEGLQHFGVLST